MPVQLKVSNSIKNLSEEFAREVNNTSGVFRPVYIVTQTEGMNNWLKMQLAEKIGIAANIRFLKPNDLIHKVYQILGGKYNQSVSSHDLNWLLYKALDESDFKNRWPLIARYYNSSDFINADQKRMGLAEKIADLFDQYQVYRTDVIENWNLNKGEDDWQKDLWLRVRDIAGEQFPDKTMVGKYILEQLENPEKGKVLTEVIPTVYFFGLSLITTYHLKLINNIGKFINIHFLIQNPAPEDYWFDEKPEKVLNYMIKKGWRDPKEESLANPLLVSWGKLIQDTFLLLFQDEDTLNHYTDIESKIPDPSSLLGNIQNSIFYNQKKGLDFSTQINDGSITINSCFNPVRELEVLYNYLVGLIDIQNQEISARDIVVMVSDIDKYAAYIRAVFDNSPYKFKYTIADERFVSEDGIVSGLMAVLSMNEQQFTSEKVVSLLDYSALKKNFKIDDTLKIREWVDAANIRFGIEGKRAEETDFVSWDYGLKRMMYGLCMSGGEEYGEAENGFYPLDTTEGFESSQVVRFVYFVQSLIASVRNRKRKRTIGEWIDFVEDTLIKFVGDREEVEDEDYTELLNQLEKYNLLQSLYTEEISYDVFIYNFLPALSTATRNRSFANRGITFCSLVPMRSIPFKVVALLGLDFDKFPRKDRRVSFDLMNADKRKGDRNLKENDKHLFLETILSAEKYLYISYTGQSEKNNTELPPSALVDELIDFISSNTENQKKTKIELVQKHPLHSFSKKYNTTENQRLYSYLLNRDNHPIDLGGNTENEEFDFDEIQLYHLERFYKNPIKAYYNRVLNIYYEEDDLSLSETELFEFNNLQNWWLRNSLIRMETDEIESFREKSVKLGTLPLKNKGLVLIEKAIEETEFLKEQFLELTSDFEEEFIDIHLEIDQSLITGRIGGVYNNQLVRYSFSKSENKYLFGAYLDYLLLIASGKSVGLKYISFNDEKLFDYNELTKEKAIIELEKIVKLYKKGNREISVFAFEINGIKPEKITELKKETFQKEVDKYFNNFKFPASDSYHIKEYKNGLFTGEESFDKYIEMAEVALVPLLGFK